MEWDIFLWPAYFCVDRIEKPKVACSLLHRTIKCNASSLPSFRRESFLCSRYASTVSMMMMRIHKQKFLLLTSIFTSCYYFFSSTWTYRDEVWDKTNGESIQVQTHLSSWNNHTTKINARKTWIHKEPHGERKMRQEIANGSQAACISIAI